MSGHDENAPGIQDTAGFERDVPMELRSGGGSSPPGAGEKDEPGRINGADLAMRRDPTLTGDVTGGMTAEEGAGSAGIGGGTLGTGGAAREQDR